MNMEIIMFLLMLFALVLLGALCICIVNIINEDDDEYTSIKIDSSMSADEMLDRAKMQFEAYYTFCDDWFLF